MKRGHGGVWVSELTGHGESAHGSQGLEVWLQVDRHSQNGVHTRWFLCQALSFGKKTPLRETALHSLDVLRISVRAQFETPTRFNHVA